MRIRAFYFDFSCFNVFSCHSLACEKWLLFFVFCILAFILLSSVPIDFPKGQCHQAWLYLEHIVASLGEFHCQHFVISDYLSLVFVFLNSLQCFIK